MLGVQLTVMPRFQLTPFPNKSQITEQIPSIDVVINGQIERAESTIEVHYVVSGDLSRVLWPTFNSSHQRKNELWNHTCFELFILPIHHSQYCEYNLSPSGSWNAYGFSGYRAGKQNLPIDAIEIRMEQDTENSCVLNSSIPLIDTARSSTAMVGISAVIEDRQHRLHYYALTHMGERPDFHLKESFIIELSNESV